MRLLIAALSILAVLFPCVLLLPASWGFSIDWVNHLWLTWMQSREIQAAGLPSLFLNVYPLGVFYPNFMFYGGTLYAIGGYLMVTTREPVGGVRGDAGRRDLCRVWRNALGGKTARIARAERTYRTDRCRVGGLLPVARLRSRLVA